MAEVESIVGVIVSSTAKRGVNGWVGQLRWEWEADGGDRFLGQS